ncbi:hypothetical protein [Nocardioides sp. SYSU D00038]|uniref:WXG100 family type VII secretion target n=1 Tax=Nocardioides sp. SYSU D00038 TaxID=2812554 RepID=UPI0027DCE78D|nr:hypothetical protein [Nocardioides sp. SYSU D00038]
MSGTPGKGQDMYGDPELMRRHAGRLREQGVDLRALADQLVGQAESIAWSGRAAEAMRARIATRAAHLRECAGRHETAAESLEEHLEEVEVLREAIADTERRVGVLVADARARVARLRDGEGGVEVLPDPVDEELTEFEPPPPGHKDWLTVSLPGL